VANLSARIEQLETLAQGLVEKVRLWKGNDDLLLFREQKAYLVGILVALAGAE
jgi:hypothetical protein